MTVHLSQLTTTFADPRANEKMFYYVNHYLRLFFTMKLLCFAPFVALFVRGLVSAADDGAGPSR